jgi:hypothetical protein
MQVTTPLMSIYTVGRSTTGALAVIAGVIRSVMDSVNGSLPGIDLSRLMYRNLDIISFVIARLAQMHPFAITPISFYIDGL